MHETISQQELEFVVEMRKRMLMSLPDNNRSVEKLALSFGIEDKTKIKELTEFAIVMVAREIANNKSQSFSTAYKKIVELYNTQINLSHRTSQSMLLQQYSTPAPISYLAGLFCYLDYQDKRKVGNFGCPSIYEPSAGNGLLTIAFNPLLSRIFVNEIDDLRNLILATQGRTFTRVSKDDATIEKPKYLRAFDIVITNPPFGSLDKPILFDDYPISALEHLMCIRALDCMKDNGSAALIIGGHTVWDNMGRIQAGRNRIFFNYLYSHYIVEDVINIDGQKLYSRQGTAFNVRLILISGRKSKVEGAAPLFNPNIDKEVHTHEALFNRVLNMNKIETAAPPKQELIPIFLKLFNYITKP